MKLLAQVFTVFQTNTIYWNGEQKHITDSNIYISLLHFFNELRILLNLLFI